MPSYYDIPSFGNSGYGVPAFGPPRDRADERASRFSLFPGADPDASITRTLSRGQYIRNPNFAYNQRIPAEVAYQARKKGGRIYAPAAAALAAQNALLGPTFELQRRAGMAQAGLFGEIAPQYLNPYLQNYLSAYRGINPEGADLLAQLNQNAQYLNSAGYANPYEDRLLQESVRSAQSARGMGYGTGDALNEILALDRAREARSIARGQYGLNVADVGRQFYAPVTGGAGGVLAGLMQQYQNPVQPTSLDDLLSISLNDTLQRRNEQAARRAAQMQLTGQIVGSVLGVASGGIGSNPGGGSYPSGTTSQRVDYLRSGQYY